MRFSFLFLTKREIVQSYSRNGNSKALSDIRRLVADPGYTPTDPKELCNRIFVTLYMGTKNSSEETKNRAALLASQIGSHHMSITIDKAVSAMMEIFSEANPGWEPKFSGTRCYNCNCKQTADILFTFQFMEDLSVKTWPYKTSKLDPGWSLLTYLLNLSYGLEVVLEDSLS